MPFRIVGLQPEQFRALRSLGDDELAEKNVLRVVADAKPGFPCRVTLRNSPYRSAHAIFVTENAVQRFEQANCVPQALRVRALSVRSFDGAGMMLDADLVDGADLESLIERLFEDERAQYLHVHYAKRGCYAARVEPLRGDRAL